LINYTGTASERASSAPQHPFHVHPFRSRISFASYFSAHARTHKHIHVQTDNLGYIYISELTRDNLFTQSICSIFVIIFLYSRKYNGLPFRFRYKFDLVLQVYDWMIFNTATNLILDGYQERIKIFRTFTVITGSRFVISYVTRLTARKCLLRTGDYNIFIEQTYGLTNSSFGNYTDAKIYCTNGRRSIRRIR